MTRGWQVVAYPGLHGFRRLETDWDRLVEEMPDRASYHTYETHRSYFAHLSESGGRFTCLALSDGERLRAICPLESKVLNILGRHSRVWGLPWDAHNLMRDVICPPGEAERELLPQVVRHLRAAAGPAWLVFDRVPAQSALSRCLASLDPRAHYTDVTGDSDWFNCDRPFDELFAGFAKQFRTNLRGGQRKLATLPDVRYVEAVEPSDVAREFRTFLELEASGWKGEAGERTAILLDPRLVAYYTDLSAMHGGVSRCEVNALYAEGRCIASQFCLRTGAEYVVLKVAYDERYPKIGPGQLLLERTMRRCCEDPGITRLNLVAHSEWLRVWRPEVMPLHTVYVGLGRWAGPPLVRLLRWRFAYGPRVKSWIARVRGKGRADS